MNAGNYPAYYAGVLSGQAMWEEIQLESRGGNGISGLGRL